MMIGECRGHCWPRSVSRAGGEHDARADGPATLADGEAHAGLERDRLAQLEADGRAVARGDGAEVADVEHRGGVAGAEEELRRVTGAEVGAASTLLFGQGEDLRLALAVRSHRVGQDDDLPALDL